MSIYELSGTSPIVPVSDLAATVRFYIESLGFEQVIDNRNYGYALVRRGDALIALSQTNDATALQATSSNIAAQIWVDDVDRLWGDVGDKLSELPEGRVRAPFEQSYGTREMHVKCPDGFLIFFTQNLP